MRKAIALLLAVMLLPMGYALAENRVVSYSVSFSSAAENNKMLQAIADFVNLLTIEGTLASYDGNYFDLYADLILNSQENTRNNLHFYGDDEHWGLSSSILGDQQLRIDTITLVEFAYKIYNHMSIPLQDLAILYPGSTDLAFEKMISAWNKTMFQTKGTRTITLNQLKKLASQLEELAQSENTFVFWLKSLAHDTTLECDVLYVLSVMDTWLQEQIGSKGMRVTVSKDGETWTANDKVFYERTSAGQEEISALLLDELPTGFSLHMDRSVTNTDGKLTGSFTMECKNAELNVLTVSGRMNNWTSQGLPVEDGEFVMHVSGTMIGIWDGLTFTIKTSAVQDDSQQLQLVLNMDDDAELTASCSLTFLPPQEKPSYVMPQIVLNTLNDDVLSDFVNAAAPTAIRRLIPIAMQAPASFCNVMMDLATDAGIFDALMPGQNMDEEW